MDNQLTSLVYLKDCLKDKDLSKYEIPICFGRDTEEKIVFKDFKILVTY